MKTLLYSDNHFCTYSSIYRARGEKYSKRLENQIDTLNWIEDLAVKENCDSIICLGDFFDKSELNAEEISALNEIRWNTDIPHIFLVGNHELGRADGSYSSTNLFRLIPNSFVVSEPRKIEIEGVEICYLPYQTESNRKSLSELFGEKKGKRIILSHNDIKGINYGQSVSTIGYGVDEIEESCDRFINGHIHNHSIGFFQNIGNVTGRNFSEDGFRYKHVVDIMEIENGLTCDNMIENPYALNFCKVDCDKDDICELNFPTNCIVTFQCSEKDYDKVKNFKNDNIIERRIVVKYEKREVNKDDLDLTIDHLQMFKDFIHKEVGESEVIDEELNYVCGG